MEEATDLLHELRVVRVVEVIGQIVQGQRGHLAETVVVGGKVVLRLPDGFLQLVRLL